MSHLPFRAIPLLLVIGVALLIAQTPFKMSAKEPPHPSVTWSELPSLPNTPGFGGPFAGVSGAGLIVAGGANFPEKPPWQGGEKAWHDKIYVLDKPGGEWRIAKQRLPCGWAYGVSITCQNKAIPSRDHRGLLCIGGDDGIQCLKDVSLLTWNGSEIQHRVLQSLPHPVSQACGALVGDTITLPVVSIPLRQHGP